MTKKFILDKQKRTQRKKTHIKKQNEPLHNTSHFLEMELKFMFEDAFCVLRMHNDFCFFIFDRLYLMTHVSSRDGKGVIFLVLMALSCGVNNFVQEELFVLTIFTDKRKP